MRKGRAQQVQSLGVELGVHQGEAGDIPARPRETGGESALHRVHHGCGDDRNAVGRVHGVGCEAFHHNDIYWKSYQFCRQLRPKGKIASGQAKLENDIAAFDIAEIAEPLPECVEVCRSLAVRHRKHADARDLSLGLLTGRRVGRNEQRGKPSDDDAATSHSMTSSARARIEGGTVRPSACAVLRLTTSSNLVGCSTGRSAGFSPERMRPTYTPTWRMRPVWLAP